MGKYWIKYCAISWNFLLFPSIFSKVKPPNPNGKPQIVPEKTTFGGPIEIITTEVDIIPPIQEITTFRPIITLKTTLKPYPENPVRSELGQNSQAGI